MRFQQLSAILNQQRKEPLFLKINVIFLAALDNFTVIYTLSKKYIMKKIEFESKIINKIKVLIKKGYFDKFKFEEEKYSFVNIFCQQIGEM